MPLYGRTFRNFTKEDGLPDNEIIKLYLDKHNNVWFLSFLGIPAVYHNGAIKRFDDCKGVFIMEEDMRADDGAELDVSQRSKNDFLSRLVI